MDWTQVTTQVWDKLSGWGETAVDMLPNMVVAVVLLLLGNLVARVVRRAFDATVHRVTHNEQIAGLGAQIVYVLVHLGALFIALGVLNLTKTVTSLLAGVGVVGLALGFAFQDIAANFMSGVMLAAQRPIRAGDMVETGGILGIVESTNLRSTVMKTFSGETVLVPNKDVFANPIINYTHTPKRRVEVTCGVTYATDLQRAEDVALQAVADLPAAADDESPVLIYTGFGNSSIDFSLRVWLDMSEQPDHLAAKSDVIKRLKRAFDEAGITIPFPIRTLDFGIEGGERLDAMLRHPVEGVAAS